MESCKQLGEGFRSGEEMTEKSFIIIEAFQVRF